MLPKFFSAIALLCLFTFAFIGNKFEDIPNHNPAETYSLVKINIQSTDDIMRLQNNGVDIEHYTGDLEHGIQIVINQNEIARLQSTGINYEIKIQDMSVYYSERSAPTEQQMQRSKEIQLQDNTEGFSYGSMGGFYTYVEIGQKLDSMRIQFPNLITAKQVIGNSVENREIWSVKISDNPDINESATEAPIYFDALHHAREPQAMASMMYYMYWLLENYGTNAEATYLVNNREIFFVPVVNPDGYVYNQTTNPNGGGFWRKNRKLNSGSCYGIDLNRNYDYGWGVNSGSSNNPCDETYRGVSAASEPETQAIKSIINQVHPKIAFSMHSVAGRYLNPYGYTDTSVSYEIYSEFASDFAASNNYTYGTVSEMLSYYSSGTTRDYLHSRGTYCWTPEVGGSDFWPSQSEIIPIANENLYGMKYLTWVGGAYTDVTNYKILGKGYVVENDTLSLQFTLKNRGLSMQAVSPSVTVIPLYQHISPNAQVADLNPINARQTVATTTPIQFIVTSSASYMDEIKFAVIVKQENIETARDTITINVGKPNVFFSDNAENGTSRWVKAGTGILWDTTFIDPYEGNKNFADSRYGNGKNSCNNTFTLIDTIDLTGTANPRIEYDAKWATEQTGDYIRIQVSTNFGSSWTSLPGRYTATVSGQPSYNNIKHWKHEQINLNAYIGKKIKIRFNLVNDGSIPGDGFYFDNFRVVNYLDTLTHVHTIGTGIPQEFSLSQNYPNPFNPVTVIRYGIPQSASEEKVKLTIYNSLGVEIETLVDEIQGAGNYEIKFDGSNYSSGIYFYKLQTGSNIETKSMMLLK